MKKFLSAFLFTIAVFVFFAGGLVLNAQAANETEKAIPGTVTKIAYSQSGDSEEIRIYTSKTTILRQFVLDPNQDCKNYRIGIEIADAVISQNGAFDINKGTVYQVRYANKTNPQAASIVIETTKKPDYSITVSSDGKYLAVKLKGSLSGSTSQNTSSTGSTPGSSTSTSGSSSTQTNKTVSSGSGTSASSVLASIGPISVSMQGDTCIVKFEGINFNSTYGSTGKKPAVTLREKEKILQVTLPGKDSRISDGAIQGNSVIYGILVNYNRKLDSTIIRIAYNKEITYTQEISGGSTLLKIKPAGTGSTGGSSGNSGSTGNSGSGGSSGNSGPTSGGSDVSRGGSGSGRVSNIEPGDGETVALKLVGTNIVSKYKQYASRIIAENDTTGSAYAFMFPIEFINLGNGDLAVNNALVSRVTTLTTSSNSFLQLHKKVANTEFALAEGSSANELLVVVKSSSGGSSGSRTDSGNTLPISVTNPSTGAKNKLVVLDAGHGGSDPGAEFSGYLEKDFNLDITLKTEAILRQKGINVRLTRSSDVFVGLEERANLANEWGADLFISIHNNSMPAGIRGSMTFYYPTSTKGKAYAKVILDNMYSKLGMGYMGSNGLRSAEYVVLKKTKMPAVLVEVACMSHDDDLNLLKSETFRQRVAEVLADSIIQILNQM